MTVDITIEGIFTCSPSALVFPDPSETIMFDLFNATTVKEGDTVTLKCETDGNPQPSFDFSKDVREHIKTYQFFTLKKLMPPLSLRH